MIRYTKTKQPNLANAHNVMDNGKPSMRFRWRIEIEIDEVWVADGFEVTEDRIHDMVVSAIGFARPDEVLVRILASPHPDEILQAQGATR